MADLTMLVDLLGDDDPKVRQQACKDLAKLNDPAAIPALAKVYEEDEDARVKAAAATALEKYAAKMPGAGGGKALQYAVMGLGGLLVVLLILNVVLRLGSGEDPAPVQTGPLNREELIAAYQDLLARTQADFTAMQTEWAALGQLPCTARLNRVQQRPLSPADQNTYPDFGFVSRLNNNIFILNAVISTWDFACQTPERGTIDQKNESNNRLNQIEASLPLIEAEINEAITNPLPTIGPAPTDLVPPTTDPALVPTTDPALVPTTDPALVPTPG